MDNNLNTFGDVLNSSFEEGTSIKIKDEELDKSVLDTITDLFTTTVGDEKGQEAADSFIEKIKEDIVTDDKGNKSISQEDFNDALIETAKEYGIEIEKNEDELKDVGYDNKDLKPENTKDEKVDEDKGEKSYHEEKMEQWKEFKNSSMGGGGKKNTFNAIGGFMETLHAFKGGFGMGKDNKVPSAADVFTSFMGILSSNIFETIIYVLIDVIGSIRDIDKIENNDISKDSHDDIGSGVDAQNIETDKDTEKNDNIFTPSAVDINGSKDSGMAKNVSADDARIARYNNSEYGKVFGADTTRDPFQLGEKSIWDTGTRQRYDYAKGNISSPGFRVFELNGNTYLVSPFGKVEASIIDNPKDEIKVGEIVKELDMRAGLDKHAHGGIDKWIEAGDKKIAEVAEAKGLSSDEFKEKIENDAKEKYIKKAEKRFNDEKQPIEYTRDELKSDIEQDKGKLDKLSDKENILESKGDEKLTDNEKQDLEKIKEAKIDLEKRINEKENRLEKINDYIEAKEKFNENKDGTIEDKFKDAIDADSKSAGKGEEIKYGDVDGKIDEKIEKALEIDVEKDIKNDVDSDKEDQVETTEEPEDIPENQDLTEQPEIDPEPEVTKDGQEGKDEAQKNDVAEENPPEEIMEPETENEEEIIDAEDLPEEEPTSQEETTTPEETNTDESTQEETPENREELKNDDAKAQVEAAAQDEEDTIDNEEIKNIKKEEKNNDDNDKKLDKVEKGDETQPENDTTDNTTEDYTNPEDENLNDFESNINEDLIQNEELESQIIDDDKQFDNPDMTGEMQTQYENNLNEFNNLDTGDKVNENDISGKEVLENYFDGKDIISENIDKFEGLSENEIRDNIWDIYSNRLEEITNVADKFELQGQVNDAFTTLEDYGVIDNALQAQADFGDRVEKDPTFEFDYKLDDSFDNIADYDINEYEDSILNSEDNVVLETENGTFTIDTSQGVGDEFGDPVSPNYSGVEEEVADAMEVLPEVIENATTMPEETIEPFEVSQGDKTDTGFEYVTPEDPEIFESSSGLEELISVMG